MQLAVRMTPLLRLGKVEEARAMGKVLLALQPGFTISGLVSASYLAGAHAAPS